MIQIGSSMLVFLIGWLISAVVLRSSGTIICGDTPVDTCDDCALSSPPCGRDCFIRGARCVLRGNAKE